jgi:hypothetical protein
MGWTAPQYSRGQVDAAGKVLAGYPELGGDLLQAYFVINNWRSSHSFPLNTFQNNLRWLSRQADATSLIAQRIKRLSSIEQKLRRFPNMQLSQMQDIGGCRAVVDSVVSVQKVVSLYKRSRIKHKHAEEYDYIKNPKQSGYRGIHLVYRYYSDRKQTYNGLRIEIQLRSKLQHAWATAVETAGTFTRQALKSSQGGQDWLRFFALMGTAIALREKSPVVPNTPTTVSSLKDALRDYEKRLGALSHLAAYGSTLQTLTEQGVNAHYYLLELDLAANQVRIQGYRAADLETAANDYLEVEKGLSTRGGDAVLVSVESLDTLRQAYPNYFADTHVFIQAVKQAIS